MAISTAILAAPYAVLQPDSSDDPGSLEPISEGSQDGEPIDRAIELDEAASAFGFLAFEWALTISFLMSSMGDVDVGGGLFVGAADDEGFRRKWSMANCRMTERRRRSPQWQRHR